MIRYFIIISFLTILSSCSNEKCLPDINKLPMYGMVNKCSEQIQIDNDFLKECDKIYENRKIAAKLHVDYAWDYFYQDYNDSAMMRFNQAWLLDSLNADTYWGFGNLLGRQHLFKESITYFEKSLKMKPDNSNLWLSASISYGQLFYHSKDINILNKTIEYLKMAISIDENNAQAYGQLAANYSYFIQKDSARKYLEIANRLDPEAVNPEVLELLKEK